MAERRAVTAATRSRYQRASKKDKGKILDEFIELTGYHRVYARSVLRTVERKIVQDQQRRASGPATGKSRKVYEQQVLLVLRQRWVILDYICGKRLVGQLCRRCCLASSILRN